MSAARRRQLRFRARWGIAALVVGLGATAGHVAQADDSPATDDQAIAATELVDVIVELHPGVSDDVASAVIAEVVGNGGSVEHRYEIMQGFSGRATVVDVDRLATDPRVESVTLDASMAPFLFGAVPFVTADVVHSLGYTGRDWTVAVIDTGVETSHPMLSGTTGTGVSGRGAVEACFTGSGSCPGGGSSATGAGAAAPCTGSSFCSHGTSVSGIAAGNVVIEGALEFGGLAPEAGLYPIRIASNSGQIDSSDLLAGLDHVWSQRANYRFAAVNLSLGIPDRLFATNCDSTSPFTTAIDRLTSAGIAVVAATGNSSQSNAVADPACVRSATAVASMYYRDYPPGFEPPGSLAPGNLDQFANIGPLVDLAAPGYRVRTSTTGGGYTTIIGAGETFSGTSAAAPVVSGVYTILRDACPAASLSSITDALRSSPRSTFARDGQTFPIVDAADALSTLNPAPPAPASNATASSTVPGAVQLSWRAAPGANGYLLTDTATGATLVVGNVTSILWAGRPGGTRTFTVTSLNNGCRAPMAPVSTNAVAVTAAPTPPAPPTADIAAGRYVPVSPTRILDTRTRDTKPGPGSTITLPVAGVAGVPPDATAVVMNLTGTAATANGFVTAYPTGPIRPTASNLNLRVGSARPNLVVVPLGSDGSVNLYTESGAHLIADLAGYWIADNAAPSAGRYEAASAPTRVLDTRLLSIPKLTAGRTLVFPIAALDAVPDDATAVIINLTGVEPTARGFVTAYPSGQARPTASNLNLVAGENRPNLAIVPIGEDGAINLYTESGAHLVVDLAGWFTGESAPASTQGLFTPVVPVRRLDTRGGASPGAGSTTPVSFIDASAAASSVIINLTGVRATARGFVTAYPQGQTRPTASNLNLLPGQTVPNAAVVAPGTGARVSLYSQSGAHLIVDLFGWFS